MKTIFALFAFSLLCFIQAAQIVKLTGNPKVLTVQELKANADGSISYTLDGKRWTAPEFSYDYARIPKPGEIIAAEKVFASGDYGKAEKLFQIEYEKYKNLGWSVHCIIGRARALNRAGRLKEALQQLEMLKSFQSVDPYLETDLQKARILYVEFLIKAKKYQAALVLTEDMLASKADHVVFFAFERKGDIALLMKDSKKAVGNYLQAYFLIDHHPRKAAVLYKAVLLLKELKDKRWIQFANLLKKRYPNSPYAKKL